MFRLTCQAAAGEVTDEEVETLRAEVIGFRDTEEEVDEVAGGDGAFMFTWRWKASTTKQNK